MTAAATVAAGAVALSRTTERRELPLAATPLLFALQQSVEGLLWLTLPAAPDGPAATGLTLLFLFLAEAFWPVYVPAAVLLIEPRAGRRRVMLACLAVGALVSASLLWWIASRPHGAAIVGGHIVYVTEQPHSELIGLAYLAATGLPLLMSSHRVVVVLGVIVLAGSATACVLYWEAFVSVWCFFAAAASVAIACHFEWSRRNRLRMAGARRAA